MISRILPEQDMPFTANGVPVDVVLNPLGVPSRMNVGQILESHLGWAAKNLGIRINEMIEQQFDRKAVEEFCLKIWDTPEIKEDVAAFISSCSDDELKDFVRKYREGVHVANPVFDGANEGEIEDALELAGLDKDGKTRLFDGLTGEPFLNRVSVGVFPR